MLNRQFNQILQRLLTVLLCTGLLCFGLILGSAAFAQSNPTKGLSTIEDLPKISISVSKLLASNLPEAGSPVEIKAELLNTRDFRQPLKLLLVLDQQFQEFLTEPGLPDSRERPQYSIKVPAPVVELEYQFILTMPDGSVVVSSRQKVRRNCQADISTAVKEIDPAINGSAKLDLLLSQNKKIENEISNLQSSVDEIKQLSGMLAK